MSRIATLIVLVFALGLPAGQATAEELATFRLELGAYRSDFDSRVQVNGETPGTDIGLEDVLAFDKDDTAFRVDGYWRFADRHRVMFGYYDLGRDTSVTLAEEIVVDDVVFPQGIGVTGGFDISVLQLAYSYSILQTQRGELGLSVGVHWPAVDFDVRGSGANAGLRAESDVNAPLPVFGADARYRLNDWLYLSGRVQFFTLDYAEYDGTLTDARVALEAWPTDWLGVGVGYSRFDLDFSVDASDWNGSLDYVYDGPQLFLVAEF